MRIEVKVSGPRLDTVKGLLMQTLEQYGAWRLVKASVHRAGPETYEGQIEIEVDL